MTGRFGPLAAFVRDRRIPLELCPTSNLNTGVVRSIAEHPIGLLTQLRFRVTVSSHVTETLPEVVAAVLFMAIGALVIWDSLRVGMQWGDDGPQPGQARRGPDRPRLPAAPGPGTPGRRRRRRCCASAS